MYSLKNLLRQEPASLTAVVVGWITVAVVGGWVDVSAETLAAGEGAILSTLLLFYVRQASVSKDAAQQSKDEALQLQESKITAYLASATDRPLRAKQREE